MTTLDELRRANLQEQRRKAEAEAEAPVARPQPETPEPSPSAKAARLTPLPKPADAPVASAKAEAPAELIAPIEREHPEPSLAGHLNGNGHTPTVEQDAPEDDSAEIAEIEDEVVIDEADRKARAIMDRFYRGLAHKVVHPTGVKTTVDMPPDLFWRVKRYCHDHNNVTVRQLFLDLVIAVLEEEGY